MSKLSELQLDALTEAFNIGMGSAAAALSEMVNTRINLSVPKVSFIDKTAAAAQLSQTTKSDLSGVLEKFDGPFSGTAMLLFPEEQSLSLVRLMLKDTVPLNSLTEFEEEALNEIGNIVLNAGIASLADMFEKRISTEIPVYTRGRTQEILHCTNEDINDVLMFLKVNFSIQDANIHGFVVYLLDVKSMREFTSLLDQYILKVASL
ncbi:hypothetical protein MNBD_GAMMA12-687 [hydrothermal vent metagenome]|uniref:CheC-like protein domain-containing protein n=1 Tax=hydrothermal vent metagenome TaxID=652676 RepID=A0A3B0Z2A2_9ZZZZ